MQLSENVSQLLLSNETKIFGNGPREAAGLRDKNTVLCILQLSTPAAAGKLAISY